MKKLPLITITFLIIIANILLLGVTSAYAAPKPELWEFWNQADNNNAQTIDHSMWNDFLRSNVIAGNDGINRVRYGSVFEADKKALDNYVAWLAATPVRSYNKKEQFAYWINLYNALTIKVILDNYPVKSIRDIDISPGLFADGPWGKKLLTIEGKEVSLDDIEHKILRPIWKDPRIHYAVNCASIGCPNLSAEAFTPANMDGLLTAGARAYVNHPRGVKLSGSTLSASSIYDWFDEDFGGNDAGIIAHIKRYADTNLKTRLEGVSRVSSYDYDWSLNEVK